LISFNRYHSNQPLLKCCVRNCEQAAKVQKKSNSTGVHDFLIFAQLSANGQFYRLCYVSMTWCVD
jgi:hypothetical protein